MQKKNDKIDHFKKKEGTRVQNLPKEKFKLEKMKDRTRTTISVSAKQKK